MLAIVTAAVPTKVLWSIFSGISSGLSERICTVHPQHARRPLGAGRDRDPRRGCLTAAPHAGPRRRPTRCESPPDDREDYEPARAAHRRGRPARRHDRARSATTRRSGCRPAARREAGRHRLYADADVERLREALSSRRCSASASTTQGAARSRGGARRVRRSGRTATPTATDVARSLTRRSGMSNDSSTCSPAVGPRSRSLNASPRSVAAGCRLGWPSKAGEPSRGGAWSGSADTSDLSLTSFRNP